MYFQWLETEFLQYLEDWETAVANREGFSVAEKKSMLLSEETSRGLKLTGTYMYVYTQCLNTGVCMCVCEM